MLRTVVLAEDVQVAQAIESLALETGQAQISQAPNGFPSNDYELTRLIRHCDPELVVLQAKNPEQALEFGLLIRSQHSSIGVLVVGPRFPEPMEAPYKKAGVELLTPPLSPEMLAAASRNAVHHARSDLHRNMLVFLPAKAGNGASTVALNVASAFGQGLSKRVLLLEADLHSGILSLALNVRPKVPLIDVLQNASELDYSRWEQTVLHAPSFDLLPTDRSKKLPLPSWLNYHQLLKYVLSRYHRVIVDLPEVVNDATAELVHYASTVYVVCTPELPSLTLAEQRLNELSSRGLPAGRSEVILNRWHKGDISVREVEDVLKRKVATVIQNDYRAVHKATLAGAPVKLESDLGKAFLNFARKLQGPDQEDSSQPATSLSLLNALRSSHA